MSRQSILGCDRVGHNREKLCHDRGLLGRDRAGHDRKFCDAPKPEGPLTTHQPAENLYVSYRETHT